MKVMICGGRDYDDYACVCSVLDEIHARTPITLLMHGNAPGADALTNLWANHHEIPVKAFIANWKQYHKAAGPIRNQDMVNEEPNLCVVFPGGNGTADAAMRAKRKGIPMIMVPR